MGASLSLPSVYRCWPTQAIQDSWRSAGWLRGTGRSAEQRDGLPGDTRPSAASRCITSAWCVPYGGVQEALQWTEQAVANPAYACDGLALQAGLYLEKRDYHHAKQVRLEGCRLHIVKKCGVPMCRGVVCGWGGRRAGSTTFFVGSLH